MTFEPVTDEDGIIASREVLREKVRNAAAEGAAGEPSNTPEYPEIEQGENSSYDKSHEIINYEINEIKETIEEQHGKVEDLSISVIIDNEALDQQILQQVKELLATAIGTDLPRITVHSMKFDTSFQDKLLDGFEKRRDGTWLMTHNSIFTGRHSSFSYCFNNYMDTNAPCPCSSGRSSGAFSRSSTKRTEAGNAGVGYKH